MKNTILIVVILSFSFIACNEKTTENDSLADTSLITNEDNEVSKEYTDSLLDYFEKIEIDDVFFVVNNNVNEIGANYLDKKYDSIFYNAQINYKNENNLDLFITTDGIIPLYRFPYSKNIEGLIVIMRGEYVHTRKLLFLYDTTNNKMYYGCSISDHLKDAGFIYHKVSWIYDINDDGFLDIVLKYNYFTPGRNENWDDGLDGVFENEITVYQGLEHEFIPVISNIVEDSVTMYYTSSNEFNSILISNKRSERNYLENVQSTAFDIDLKYYQEFNDFYGKEDDNLHKK